ncbi:hypothetical protein BTVI_109571 [Pitangus sulphuratus]|nr:hypothetical protein BTVI_109571 [Pitangus sulphuratus]
MAAGSRMDLPLAKAKPIRNDTGVATGSTSVGSHQKLPPYQIEPMTAGSKTDPPLVEGEVEEEPTREAEDGIHKVTSVDTWHPAKANPLQSFLAHNMGTMRGPMGKNNSILARPNTF